METVRQYIKNNRKKFLSELFELLRLPSVSSDPKHKPDMAKTAEFVRKKLAAAGVDRTAVCATGGHPAVYGEKIIDKKRPTVLVYGHYDVQPVDPLNLWRTPPFAPAIRNGKIFARGASDDKGQMYAQIKAAEYLIKKEVLSVNVKFLIEGEEEAASSNLDLFIKKNRSKLRADIVLISDTGIIDNHAPAITVGIRGISYVEIEIAGPNRDLHSGEYGGAVDNPLNVLCGMIAGLKNKNGRITIPGFYDDVVELSPAERREMAKIPFDETAYKKKLGLKALDGEKGYSAPERVSIRPTLDVNGLWGGYTGEGLKTVLPARAQAKITMRLVPDQKKEKVERLFMKYFRSIAPSTVRVKFTDRGGGGEPYATPLDSPAYRAAEKAYTRAFGRRPFAVREGGSIPVTALFKDILGADSMLMGFGLDADAIHSPDENFGVFNYLKAIEAIIYFYEFYGKGK